MSHVVTIKCQIRDLASLDLACKRVGFELVRGKKSFEWYGRWVGDYDGEDAAYRNGLTTEEYGQCDHVIKVPGAKYEIGLKAQNDGAFKPVFDNFSPGGLADIKAENGMKGLLPAYAAEVAKAQLRRKGYTPIESVRNGKIVVSCNA